MFNRLVIIGNYDEEKNNGPTGVIKGLIKGFKENDFLNYQMLLFEKNMKKSQYIVKILKKIHNSKDCVINVHTDGYLIPFFVFMLSLFFKQNKYYLTCHGIGLMEKQYEVPISRKNLFIEKILYKHFPNLICVSKMQKNDISKIYHRVKNVYVIENGTDAWEYKKKNAKALEKKSDLLRILTLGGLSECKGLHETLKLCKKLHDNGIKYKLDIYGSVRNEKQYTDFLEELNVLGIQEYVAYKKYIEDKSELYEIIQKYDVMLCLSRYDTFNVAILEAIALGCYCVTSEKCGASEIINSKNLGIVYDYSNDKEVISYFKSIANNQISNENFYQYENIRKHYSWKGVSRDYMNLVNYE